MITATKHIHATYQVTLTHPQAAMLVAALQRTAEKYRQSDLVGKEEAAIAYESLATEFANAIDNARKEYTR